MHPHLFNDTRPPAVRVAGLGDLGGAIGAALLAQLTARASVGRVALPTDSTALRTSKGLFFAIAVRRSAGLDGRCLWQDAFRAVGLGIGKEESHIGPPGSTTGGSAGRPASVSQELVGERPRRAQHCRTRRRAGALILALVVVALVILGGGSTYTLNADFQNASGLVTGDNVLIGPAAVGTVNSIGLTANGAAQVSCRCTATSSRCTRARSRGSTRTRCRGSPASTSSWSRGRARRRRSRTAARSTSRTPIRRSTSTSCSTRSTRSPAPG